MAPSPQKASWRRVDTTPSDDDDDVGVGGVSSGTRIRPSAGAGEDSTYFHPYTYTVSRQQSSMLAGQGVSSSLDDFPLPSTTLQAISSPPIASAYRCTFSFQAYIIMSHLHIIQSPPHHQLQLQQVLLR